MALIGKRDRRAYRVFAMLSDGECDEGSTWEAALFAPHHRLDNLVVIVDANRIQALGHTVEVLDLDPFADKWRAFGWAVREIDGHSITEIEEALLSTPFSPGRPSCIIAHTIKGKGISFMEDRLLWHYRSPQGEEYVAACNELEHAT
jgi:transketolase